MAKGRLPYFEQSDFRGGINQEIEEAGPNQVEDARNVWARFGELQQRPGYEPRLGGPLGGHDTLNQNASDSEVLVDTSGGAGSSFTDIGGSAYSFSTAGNFDQDDIVYFGWSDDPSDFSKIAWTSSISGSSEETTFAVEYYDGSNWSPITATTYGIGNAPWITPNTSQGLHQYLLGNASGFTAPGAFTFVAPADWATTTVNSLSRYWIRWRAISGDVTDAGGSVSRTVRDPLLYSKYDTSYPPIGMGSWDYQGSRKTYWWLLGVTSASNKNKLSIIQNVNLTFPSAHNTTSSNSFSGWRWDPLDTEEDLAGIDEVSEVTWPAVAAMIPEYSQHFIAYAHKIYKAPYINDVASNYVGGYPTSPESREHIVGSTGDVRSIYHPDYIDILGSAPAASIILWHQSTLWAADIRNCPHQVRWSAPSFLGIEGYGVWPSVSSTELVSVDRSGITGLFVHDEHVHVAKRDSLWRMVFLGTTPEGLANYEAVKVFQGVGSVSHHSIVNTPVGTVFLYEDGFYLYDGGSVQKISRPINKVVSSISPHRYKYVQGVHWATQRCVLWTVSIDAPDVNDHILVWDYENNSWWVWDSIEAEILHRDEGDDDRERIYFLDSKSRLFEFGVGTRDNGGAITAYALTHRFGYKDPSTKKFRRLYVNGTNKQSTNDVTVIVQDRDNVSSVAMDFTDAAEKKWTGSLPAGAKWGSVATYSEKRRTERVDWRESGEYAQVKVQNANKHEELKVSSIRLEFAAEGRRK